MQHHRPHLKLTGLWLPGILMAMTAAAQPPVNPNLAQSSWPIYHANNSATASVTNTAVTNPTNFESVVNLTHRRFRAGQVSPWTVLRAPGPDGTQVVITNPLNGVGKYRIQNGRLEAVDFLRLDRKLTDIDWGILLLSDGSALVTERIHNRFAVVGDSGRDPASPLKVLRHLPVDREQYGGLTSHFTMAYDGTIIAYTTKPAIIAIHPADGHILASYATPKEFGTAIHNSFPMDERGRIYLLGQRAMTAVDWNGTSFKLVWTAHYNMRGPGFEHVKEDRRPIFDAVAVAKGKPGTGSGTTPSLIGNAETGIVVVVDGHSPNNNLVAFWRGKIPKNWVPLPDPNKPGSTLDPRVAGVIALPHSTPEGDGHTAENSPAVLGNAIVIAQWAGFKPGPNPPKGVQRVDWNPNKRRFELVWANADVHINGVPSIGKGPGHPLVFGMGREDANYIYSVIDFRDGKRVRKIDLGESDDVLDQGCSHAIAADGSIIYGGKRRLVRLFEPY